MVKYNKCVYKWLNGPFYVIVLKSCRPTKEKGANIKMLAVSNNILQSYKVNEIINFAILAEHNSIKDVEKSFLSCYNAAFWDGPSTKYTISIPVSLLTNHCLEEVHTKRIKFPELIYKRASIGPTVTVSKPIKSNKHYTIYKDLDDTHHYILNCKIKDNSKSMFKNGWVVG